MIRVCPRLYNLSKETFSDKLPTDEMRWSVRALLEFSYTPTINEAFEGAQTTFMGNGANLTDQSEPESDPEQLTDPASPTPPD